MKLHLCIVLMILAVGVPAVAQKIKKEKELTPARGYYRQLSVLDPAPASSNIEIDQQKFPFDRESADRRLSLTPYYLQNVALNDFKIPDPPANSSGQTRSEINYLLRLQQERTEIDVQNSLYMAGIFYNLRITPQDSSYHAYRKNLFFIGRTIGTWFNPDDLPVTANLVANVWRDASYFIWSMKYKYLRIRPYVIEPALNNLEETNWAAYPSGHAANSYINAYVYQELAPEFTDVFLKDAYDMAHSREIIGVHYPSDSEASRIFARQFVNKLFQNEKFLRDFEEAKKEWAEKGRENLSKPLTTSSSKPKPASCTIASGKKCE